MDGAGFRYVFHSNVVTLVFSVSMRVAMLDGDEQLSEPPLYECRVQYASMVGATVTHSNPRM